MPPRQSIPGLIGVIHLPPLAGTAGIHDPSGALQVAGLQAVKEARLLAQAGFEGVILENFGDAPFFTDQVPPETIASMAVIAAAVRESIRLPIGINVLRNDARAALAIAAVCGCQFIRVNVLSGVAATDQGIITGRAAELSRERDRLGAPIRIFADAHVKHARSLSSENIALAVEELALRAKADAVILTGATTGRPIERSELLEASRAAHHCRVPLYAGSGTRPDSLAELLPHLTGVIVGSALRRGGHAGAPMDAKRTREFARSYRKRPKTKR